MPIARSLKKAVKRLLFGCVIQELSRYNQPCGSMTNHRASPVSAADCVSASLPWPEVMNHGRGDLSVVTCPGLPECAVGWGSVSFLEQQQEDERYWP